jgi:ferredoxin
MIRKIITIDVEKCDGCGLCVSACHEGAIGLENGKAKLLRDDYCDGLGNCLPVCPTGAISFIEREALAFNADAVETKAPPKLACGCPGTNAKKIIRPPIVAEAPAGKPRQSCLGQWPVQIQLVPVNAPYFENASLLVAADCAAYAHADFHAACMQNRITIIGCPKLDTVDYTEKLTAILKTNAITSLAIARMEVPCCAGIANAAIAALQASGKIIPWRVITISVNGEIVRDE